MCSCGASCGAALEVPRLLRRRRCQYSADAAPPGEPPQAHARAVQPGPRSRDLHWYPSTWARAGALRVNRYIHIYIFTYISSALNICIGTEYMYVCSMYLCMFMYVCNRSTPIRAGLAGQEPPLEPEQPVGELHLLAPQQPKLPAADAARRRRRHPPPPTPPAADADILNLLAAKTLSTRLFCQDRFQIVPRGHLLIINAVLEQRFQHTAPNQNKTVQLISLYSIDQSQAA